MESQVLASRVVSIYEALESQNIETLREIYSDEIVFEDPAHKIKGLDSLLQYFRSMYANVIDCQFNFESVIVDRELIALTWVMSLRHPKLKKGLTIEVQGSSVLKIEQGKIVRHRDYFDLGAMVYEHLPILGKIVAGIKRRLGQ